MRTPLPGLVLNNFFENTTNSNEALQMRAEIPFPPTVKKEGSPLLKFGVPSLKLKDTRHKWTVRC